MLLRLDARAAVLADGVRAPASLLLDPTTGRIVAAGAPATVDAHPAARSASVEALEGTLLPGFVDLQVNGAAGHDFRRPDAEGAARALAALLRTGVTTCCPTVITQPADRYAGSLRAIAEAAATGAGPRVAGVHLEGPFLAEEQRGAHHRPWLQAPSARLVDEVLGQAPLPVAVWTLAPELPGAADVVRRLASAGTVVSAGHTAAPDEVLDAAVDAGLSMVTHLANGMPPFHHRRPGPVGWALRHPTVRVGLVVDGHHLHATTLALFRALLGRRGFGVTDALHTLGLPPGAHELDGVRIDSTTGVARLDGPSGTLAGATVGMDAVARRLLAEGEPLEEVVRLCCTNPADALGTGDVGRLAPGLAADVLLFDDAHALSRIWLGGRDVGRARRN